MVDRRLLCRLDIAFRTHEDLPCVAEAGEDACHVDFPCRHHVACEVGVGAGAQYQLTAADAFELTVGTVGSQGDAAVAGGKDCLAVSALDFHSLQCHEFAAV